MLGGMAQTAMPPSSQIASLQKVPPTSCADCYLPPWHGLLARVGLAGWMAETAVLGGLHVAISSSRTAGQIVKGNPFLKGH
jgi:hypothetical protein